MQQIFPWLNFNAQMAQMSVTTSSSSLLGQQLNNDGCFWSARCFRFGHASLVDLALMLRRASGQVLGFELHVLEDVTLSIVRAVCRILVRPCAAALH